MGFRETGRGFAGAAVIGTLIFGSAACGISNAQRKASLSSAALVQTCALPNGSQDNSLQGHWQTVDLPIKVSFNSASGWNADELGFMLAASDTWNAFFLASKGGDIFNAGSAAAPNTSNLSQGSPDCSQAITSDGSVVYKRGVWSKGSGIIALTSFCSRSVADSAVPVIYNAMLEMNYQNYFTTASGKVADLQSIMLHELGHLLGLGHSCGPLSNGLTNVDCPADGAADSLSLASTVMYPDWSFTGGVGEQRRSLTENDQGRANCLY